MYILEKLHTLIDGLKKYVLFKQFSVLRSGVGAWGMVGDFYPFLFLRPPHLLNIICHIYIKISIFHVLKKELLFHNSSRREFSDISLGTYWEPTGGPLGSYWDPPGILQGIF